MHCYAADLVVALHVTWNLFLLSIAWTPRENRGEVITHAVMVLITIVVWILFAKCPLLTWENHLRGACDPNFGRITAFIPYYANEWFGIPFPPECVALSLVFIIGASWHKLWYLHVH